MFTSSGPTLRELAVQALSSVERGYDLLAPKFDETPFRTPGRFLDPFVAAVRPLGPFGTGLDVCTGTGAGVGVLRRLCEERVVGVDFSGGMLDRARAAHAPGPDPAAAPAVEWVRADARALPFAAGFDLAVSFGAFGHFLPEERPALFAGVCRALRPGGVFAFPLPAPPPVGSLPYWTLWGFDAAMRVRNAVWRPPFVMYYRTFPLGPVRADLERAGFAVELRALEELGRRPDGSPNCRLVVARRRG
ncbi:MULTISPECIES: class I SAM-dependent methyltransferase [Streptomyces]|uniref:Class I SAM-dependent methyltransferase n=1 Tax=Streptomyces tsukubensis (strain DSM 42081 / NBRC 108919 / NRRL 18488 / 9993) TaxID=1114943 RepID=I2N8R4_STRT9|nr:class I SAM-dependent methyltransferase [Streptomyces tsukubensis]MYS64089.1 methyltransferase domain-containing protein [Streptomyces sp. SID5473]AZK97282.1 SAM-dependent methyltransferase [Streptomyces tsukubensis]EIF93411.1 methyltransferase [Streptomyces tsukubensis NRRL18488]QKM66753.1 class I SAM-dependent methyltransferase [Streptomyces tsukubensis NRRL18488]TAI44899.1 class I SAM-dependent methyltransferase [Streptomyces tsukubensis]